MISDREHCHPQRQDPRHHNYGTDDHCIVVGDQTQACDQAGANRQNDEGLVQPCFAVVTAVQFFETILIFEERLLINNHGWRSFSCDAPQ